MELATPITETYMEVRNLIFKTVHSFRAKYGGDLEELMADANTHFMKAHRTYNPDKGPFLHWVKFQVRTELLETLRKTVGQNNRLPRRNLNLGTMPTKVRFNLLDFLGDLSEDAATVVRLSLDCPSEIKRAIGGRDPRKCRLAIASVLKSLGWNARRVGRAYVEIRKALT